MRLLLFGAFVGTVWAANWALTTWGVVTVAPGLVAPAGVWFAGLGFLLRDALNEIGGRAWVLSAIAAGTCLSWWVGADVTLPGGMVPIAVASGCAFALAEICDWAAYAPLRRRNLPAAVGVSQVVGAVADSLLFLWLAGLLTAELFAGQVVGKTLMVLPVVAALVLWRARAEVYRECDGKGQTHRRVTLTENGPVARVSRGDKPT